jgi:hypothetical protein
MGVGAAPRSGLGAGRGRGAAREGGGGGSGRRRWAGSSGAGWPGRARPDRRTAREDRGGGGRPEPVAREGRGGRGRVAGRPGRRRRRRRRRAVCVDCRMCVWACLWVKCGVRVSGCGCVWHVAVCTDLGHTAKHSNFARSIESYEKKNKMTTPCRHGYWLGWPVTLLQACS